VSVGRVACWQQASARLRIWQHILSEISSRKAILSETSINHHRSLTPWRWNGAGDEAAKIRSLSLDPVHLSWHRKISNIGASATKYAMQRRSKSGCRCVRACVCLCAHAYVRMCMRACVYVCGCMRGMCVFVYLCACLTCRNYRLLVYMPGDD